MNDLKTSMKEFVKVKNLDGLGMDKSEREIYYEYRIIKEKEICQACQYVLVRFKEFVKVFGHFDIIFPVILIN